MPQKCISMTKNPIRLGECNMGSASAESATCRWRGSQVEVTIGGEFSKYKGYIVKYLREMAVITPYARFEMHYICEDSSKSFQIIHSRRSENMPPPPCKAKVHPSALDNQMMENLINQSSQKVLLRFLTAELDSVDTNLAKRMIDEFGSEFSYEMPISSIDNSKIRKIVDKILQFEFDPPSGAVLSPAGEYNLHLGNYEGYERNETRPDSDKHTGCTLARATTFSRLTIFAKVTVVDGHPVIVEAAVSLGGRKAKEGITVIVRTYLHECNQRRAGAQIRQQNSYAVPRRQ
eukprot:751321-Hanusia_phi.AAC.5